MAISLKKEKKTTFMVPLQYMKLDNINYSYCENKLLCINLNATLIVISKRYSLLTNTINVI